DHARPEPLDRPVQPRQMHLEPVQRRTSGVELEEAAVDPLLQIDPDRAHVADDLLGRFLEQEHLAALAAPAGSVEEVGRQAGFASTGGAGDEDRAPAEVPLAAEHRVEPSDAGRDALPRRGVREADRGHRQGRDPFLVYQERILVGAVWPAAILHDAKATRRDLLGHAVVEQDHRVRDVFLEALPRQGALTALAGDDGRHALVLQPAEQAAQLGAEDRLVRQAREERLDRVEHDALGADRIDREPEPDEEPFEIVVAGLLDLAALDLDVIEHDLLLLDQRRQVEAERGHVLRELVITLLEAQEHARLAELHRAVDEEADREERLAAAGSAADQRRPSRRQTPARDLIEAVDTGGRFG